MAISLPVSLPVAPLSLRPTVGPALPLAHYLLAALSLPLAFLLAVWKGETMAAFYYLPENIAATHLLTLGVLTATALGSLQALLPLGPLPKLRRWSAWSGYAVLAAGLAWFVALLLQGNLEKIWPAVALAYLGICLEILGLLLPMVALDHFDASALGIALAQINLLTAGAAGLLYAIDKRWPFLQFDFFGRLYAHIHLAALGFLLTLFVAVAHQLIPMFLWSDKPRHRFAWVSVLGVGLGAQALFWCLLLGKPWWPAAAAIAAGFALFALDGHGFVRSRRRAFPAVLRQTMAAEFVLLLAALGALWFLHTGDPQSTASFRLRFAYGVLLVAGALLSLVLGVLGRLAPEIVWYAALRPAPGEAVQRRPESLLRERFYLGGGLLLLAGVLTLALAAGRGDALLFRNGAIIAACGALLQSAMLLDCGLWLLPSARTRRLAAGKNIDINSLRGDKEETRQAEKLAAKLIINPIAGESP